jgi:ETFB lysine methyltransferase
MLQPDIPGEPPADELTGGAPPAMRRKSVPLSRLEADLRRRFRVVEFVAELGGREVSLLKPANADDLISEADFVRDDRMPYWADLWPASTALAEHVLTLNPGRRRLRLLELGCGIGFVSVAAVMAGMEVLATDYYDDALEFARINVSRVTGVDLATRMLDWRQLPPEVCDFDLVVASDVLYEERYPPLVAGAFAHTLADDGTGWLSDPGRVAAPLFLDECPRLGMTIDLERTVPYEHGKIRQRVDLYRIAKTSAE